MRPIIKSCQLLMTTSGKKTGRKLVRAISAESIYRCMLLFLDHILYRRAHFVRKRVASVARYNLNAYMCQIIFFPFNREHSSCCRYDYGIHFSNMAFLDKNGIRLGLCTFIMLCGTF